MFLFKCVTFDSFFIDVISSYLSVDIGNNLYLKFSSSCIVFVSSNLPFPPFFLVTMCQVRSFPQMSGNLWLPDGD